MRKHLLRLALIGLLGSALYTSTAQAKQKPSGPLKLVREYLAYEEAIAKFQLLYGYFPGDMPTATSIWGKDNAHCPSDTGEPSVKGTCNGNGDGIIDGNAGQSGSSEAAQFWRQLALAGLIEGNYTGVGLTQADIAARNFDKTVPVLKNMVAANNTYKSTWQKLVGELSPNLAVLSVAHLPNTADVQTQPPYMQNVSNNVLILGEVRPDGTTTAPVVYPIIAANIDAKLDDGVAATGRVWTPSGTQCTTSDVGGGYNIKMQSKECVVYIRLQK